MATCWNKRLWEKSRLCLVYWPTERANARTPSLVQFLLKDLFTDLFIPVNPDCGQHHKILLHSWFKVRSRLGAWITRAFLSTWQVYQVSPGSLGSCSSIMMTCLFLRLFKLCHLSYHFSSKNFEHLWCQELWSRQRRRWYILFEYSFANIEQYGSWNPTLSQKYSMPWIEGIHGGEYAN